MDDFSDKWEESAIVVRRISRRSVGLTRDEGRVACMATTLVEAASG